MRIAFCVGGELRTFLKYVDIYRQIKISALNDHGVTIDFYGHYWDHSYQQGIDDIDFFNAIEHSAQTEISDWIAEDFIFRAQRSGIPENLNIIDDTQAYVNYYLENSKKSLGQVVSACKALALAPGGYDVYIRSRWDAFPKNLDYDKLQEIRKSTAIEIWTEIDRLTLAGDHTKGIFNDVVFTMTQTCHSKIVKYSIYEYMEEIFKYLSKNAPPMEAHDAWWTLLSHIGCVVNNGNVGKIKIYR